MTNTINSLTNRIAVTKPDLDLVKWEHRLILKNQLAIMQGMVEILQRLSQPEQHEKEGENFKMEIEADDPLIYDAIKLVREKQYCSTELLKTTFVIGDNRAGRLIDCLEHNRIVAQFDGNKKRKVLIH